MSRVRHCEGLLTIPQAADALGEKYTTFQNKVTSRQVPIVYAYGARYIDAAYVLFVQKSRESRTNFEGVEL